jgi:hypothetical protein
LVVEQMLNAGLGADTNHMVDGLLYGFQHNRPFQVMKRTTGTMPHKRMAVKLLVPRRTFSVTFST